MSAIVEPKTHRSLWRSLDELAETPEFHDFLHREFPGEATVWDALNDPLSRRFFIKIMGASFALAGFGACTRMPKETIIPAARPPEDAPSPASLDFATQYPMAMGGLGRGIVVRSHQGRPTKIEGNPDCSPGSTSGSDPFTQASILSLYDPDRLRTVLRLGEKSSWDLFENEISRNSGIWDGNGGSGLSILTESLSSPTLDALLEKLSARFPRSRTHSYEPFHRQSSQKALGGRMQASYKLENARVILSLDSDFLGLPPGNTYYSAIFSKNRRIRDQAAPKMAMNRLYCVEPTPSSTGASADHRLSLRSDHLEAFTRVLCYALEILPPTAQTPFEATLASRHAAWISALARDLKKNEGASVIMVGDFQPPSLHRLGMLINRRLGNLGKTVVLSSAPPEGRSSLDELSSDLRAGKVETILILGGNPVYSCPNGFEKLLEKAPLRIHLSQYANETSRHCQWVLPESHFLESWGDTRSIDGSAGLLQPLISPLHDSRSALEVLLVFLGEHGATAHQVVQEQWRKSWLGLGNFETLWRQALAQGIIKFKDRKKARPRSLSKGEKSAFQGADRGRPASGHPGLEICIRPDPTVWDGRFSNNAWLQELPKPILQTTWENALILSPSTASRYGLTTHDIAELRNGDTLLEAPVLVLPGQADECVTLHAGYGRTAAGSVGDGLGFNAFLFKPSVAEFSAYGGELRKTGRRGELALVHSHHLMEAPEFIRRGSLALFQSSPSSIVPTEPGPAPRASLFPRSKREGHAWAMVIDQTVCIGCNTCTIACQAENNIPVVGRQEVIRGREMHWIRVDRYYEGSVDTPAVYFQPVPCMHCENAPCELVCPVAATVHDDEGINQMVYNRCVGTRYCSNNCPYKVRRFNFFEYSKKMQDPLMKLQANPDVTIRSRGVMEKCTYCIQRINETRIRSELEGRRIKDGEIQTACQQACPTQAIVFGDLADPGSEVTRLKSLPLNYDLLAELNTIPRTSYLARIGNPNPALHPGTPSKGSHGSG